MADLYQHIATPSRPHAVTDVGTIGIGALCISDDPMGITRIKMSRMTAKGQVAIPKRLRDHLGLKPGSIVDFELADNGEVVVRAKEKQRGGRFDALRGSAKFGMTTDELMRLLRGNDKCPNAGRGWY